MSINKARVRTLQAIVAGIPCLATHATHLMIQDEFNSVHLVRKVRRKERRRFLELLHSSRALDTALAAFVKHHGCASAKSGGRQPSNLGAYLLALRDHKLPGLRAISEVERKRFQVNVVNIRNLYMHQAGANPTSDAQIHNLLAEMQACLVLVSRL